MRLFDYVQPINLDYKLQTFSHPYDTAHTVVERHSRVGCVYVCRTVIVLQEVGTMKRLTTVFMILGEASLAFLLDKVAVAHALRLIGLILFFVAMISVMLEYYSFTKPLKLENIVVLVCLLDGLLFLFLALCFCCTGLIPVAKVFVAVSLILLAAYCLFNVCFWIRNRYSSKR